MMRRLAQGRGMRTVVEIKMVFQSLLIFIEIATLFICRVVMHLAP